MIQLLCTLHYTYAHIVIITICHIPHQVFCRVHNNKTYNHKQRDSSWLLCVVEWSSSSLETGLSWQSDHFYADFSCICTGCVSCSVFILVMALHSARVAMQEHTWEKNNSCVPISFPLWCIHDAICEDQWIWLVCMCPMTLSLYCAQPCVFQQWHLVHYWLWYFIYLLQLLSCDRWVHLSVFTLLCCHSGEKAHWCMGRVSCKECPYSFWAS